MFSSPASPAQLFGVPDGGESAWGHNKLGQNPTKYLDKMASTGC